MTTNTATALRQEAAFDHAKAETFAGTLIGAMNSAALILMSSIGHRTGLFARLAEHSPCTVADLAARSGLAERYVREWLSSMTAARVVEYDPQDKTFTLPAEHATFLTYGGPANIAVDTQFLGVAAGVEDEIVARFRDGRGMHYHHYGRFHEVMAESSHQAIASKLTDCVLPLAPGLAGRLEAGIDVIDVGCGAGGALLELARRFPKSRFTGIDLCTDAFEPTLRTARAEGLSNLSFRQVDIADVDTLGAFDLILAFDAVHDQKDPQGMLRTIRRSLRVGGVFLMAEIGGSSHLERNIGHPLGAYLYMISCMHCTPVSLGQGGAGLGTMWGVELAGEMLAAAGFSSVTVSRLPHDIVNAYFVARP